MTYNEVIDELRALREADEAHEKRREKQLTDERIAKMKKIAEFIIDKWRYQTETAAVIAVSEAEDVLFLVAEVERLNGVEQ